VSYKKRLGMKTGSNGNDAGMEEVEVCVTDFEKMAQIFQKIGFLEKHFAEKKRVRWKREDTEFDIDFYPLLEPYLEIETTSWEKIDEAIQLLGLNSEDKKMFSANQVYALKGIKVSEMQSITFAEGAVAK
jgi:adenylate cyclase class 2